MDEHSFVLVVIQRFKEDDLVSSTEFMLFFRDNADLLENQ